MQAVANSPSVTQPAPDTLDTTQLLNTLISLKRGDFSVRLPATWTGVAGKIADTLNEVIELNEKLASELRRISQAVGKEGKISHRLALPAIGGSWSTLIESVNDLIDDLTRPTNEMARVIGAVANGDLRQRMGLEVNGRPLEGQFLQTARTVNTMVEQLNGFASEVTRVAREVGTEGKLGGQAVVPGVAGTWKDLTDNVNLMAGNLTAQVRNIADVTTAVANGDLTKKITVDVRGEILDLKNTINTMVDQLNGFASEVTRVAREVGTEGKLGGQAEVKGVAGTWKDLTDNVNQMAGNLTGQVRNIANVTTAVANGDLTKKITVDVKGEIAELKNTINTMVDQLNGFASEVTRVAREVGTEGKLGGQAEVKGVAGTWKDLTDNVNLMAGNLTGQVRNIAAVTTAVANGDLTKKITVDVRGEILELKDTINTMVDQLNAFASEVTRVAREVGTEGKLGGQAEVKGVAGTWKDLTDNVNQMAGNLTSQVRNIAGVSTAIANGDLTKKITVDVRGEILELKNTINTMVDQLNAFASEVTRVAREVGTEGKLGGQADVRGVAGTWKDLTDNVNLMAGNLTGQVRNIAEVTTAVAKGDLSKKITVDVRGEILELKNTINTMVDQLNAFASEVTRVAREVGTEGKLGGQAEVKGVAGIWEDLTDNVNLMAGNLTGQVRNIAEVTTAVAKGDLSKKITVDVRGEILELKDTINTMVDQLRSFASEVTRVAREVGTEGRLGGQASVFGVAGTWKDLTDNVNLMAGNLTAQVRNIANVTTAVANGDLTKKITVDVKGEILELKDTINTMVDQLNGFANEVTRVAREVGTEGKLGGQAQVKGVAGTWKDLTDNVNQMASNLTAQVRGIAKVVTGVANGDLRLKLQVEAKGEIAELADTINGMIDTLATFADQVTSVAREVGVDGRLGGQALVPGAAGTWKGLTDNVNQLAENLTTQVRAIAEVATAVTKGDLTRSIRVEAKGEVEDLKDNINEMINNLRETTQKNAEQDWLKTNLARFTRMLQGQRDLLTVSRLILSELAPLINAQHGMFFLMDTAKEPLLNLLASYAFKEGKHGGTQFHLGEGLIGQCAAEKSRIVIRDVPGTYLHINSGLGEATPANIVILPVLFEGQIKAVIELASFQDFSATHINFLEQLTESIGIVINTIEANMRTEELLKQSQSLARELQARQQELQQTNEALEEKARLLVEQNSEVERKNREVEQAKSALEEKATQLTLTSKYKSEFLANMSHELRTPLNSLLILAHQLADNPDGNLTQRQVQFAKTIHAAGSDLMGLINDILDLSKIESGTVTVEIDEVQFDDLREYVDRTFRHVAEDRKLAFDIQIESGLPPVIATDSKRLRQVLKNLLSNAFKFTHQGRVALKVEKATGGWNPEHTSLNNARAVIALSVTDTGIGISPDKQKLIFEAFQQADGSTARKYGGTGLGLSISREIARLLGGEIRLQSSPGEGSTFTLFLPDEHPTQAARGRNLGVRLLADSERETPSPAMIPAPRTSFDLEDDVARIEDGDRVLLIVENELGFARILQDLAHQAGLKVLVATSGDSALALARRYKPAAVTLDLRLPDMPGAQVIETFKNSAEIRDIPIHVVSGVDEGQEAILQMGAASYWVKPVDPVALGDMFRDIKSPVTPRVLVVSRHKEQAGKLVAEIESKRVQVSVLDSGAAALKALREAPPDCVIVEPDMLGWVSSLSEDGDGAKRVPIIAYSESPLTKKQAGEVKKLSKTLPVRAAESPQRLAETIRAIIQPRSVAHPAHPRQVIRKPDQKELDALTGKRVLVVDDDVRNIFALTSLLERYKMRVVFADNGRAAIRTLQETPDMDIVLMDIMMPEMDGYDTTRAIRKIDQFKNLPIIALTARAMKGDREKCIEAGASDYIPKPVAPDELLAQLCEWTSKRGTHEAVPAMN
jgi:HAMP domain-containing protein/signal transduction histidine kinase/DNA-binding response OmpR family regulator